MMYDSGFCTSNQKLIRMRMKAPICFNSKGNEIITYCSFGIGPCLLSRSHCCYMCYCRQCSLDHIVQVGSIMTMSIKVWKSSLVIKISTYHRVWRRTRWETSILTCVPLSKAIVPTILQSVLWAIICSFSQGHQSKWVRRLSMVWPH
jgi:hypothetical protein